MPAQANKKGVSKKVDASDKKVFMNAIVTGITDKNGLVLATKKEEEKNPIVVIAYLELPRFDKKQNKEETFAYECGELLRKKLVNGKEVKFEVISEATDNIPKMVIPFVNGENIALTLLENGYGILKGKGKEIDEYTNAENKAKRDKKGVYCDTPEKVSIKKPTDPKLTTKELDFYVNKSLNGHIKKVDAPGQFIVETPERKIVRVSLFGINQHAPFNVEKKQFEFDDIAKEAIKFNNKNYNQRDCVVKIMDNGKRVTGIITVDKKDIAEELLKNGYVTVSTFEENTESVKKVYEEREALAKKERKGRFVNFDQAAEDAAKAKKEKREKDLKERKKNARVIRGANILFIGKYLRIEKDGEILNVKFASIKPLYKKDDKAFNELIEFRMREVIRKLIVGKKFECKEAYKSENKKGEETITEVYYDVYADKTNVAIPLLKEGLVVVDERVKDQFYQSFDYSQLKAVPKKTYKPVPITNYSNLDNVKDMLIGNNFKCIIEKAISLTVYLIYIPEKNSQLIVHLQNCFVPKDDSNDNLKKFVDNAKTNVKQLCEYREVLVEFKRYNKGNLYVEILNNGTDLAHYILEHGFAIPTGRYNISSEIEQMKENMTQIYQFDTQKKKEVTEVVEKKPKRITEIKFSAEQKVYLTGFDGEKIGYYDNAEDAKIIEEVNTMCKTVKKGAMKPAVGDKCIVESKGFFYRAEFVEVATGANVLKCIDTGAVIICGKNKLKPITEEIAGKPVTVKTVGLVGLKTLTTKDVDFSAAVEAVASYYKKEVSLFVSGEEAKVVVEGVCINTYLVQHGLAFVDKHFHDNSEWGVALLAAQSQAKENHLNVWRYGEVADEEEKN
ncbi:hypothetical protein EDI_231780 [Entamoeba dispar SAW760]|uniref:Uncharacterized protein n=1 Tax=Entamoeba dispar (strain ATCC PRA-260 / SAW760) TaxID=370354 RepID=B0ELP5_ENTDS|nr:uncharacterized protein EDI_231780 [Entamoeba dispar SAW760]EDR24545.1 hypothetical protein EDI_231780 [Entamoeba dispar SAW760]|eukprot:EDR24545.1 hypothetical protein EDI_231780 [Entamoeba dispar SAW760]